MNQMRIYLRKINIDLVNESFFCYNTYMAKGKSQQKTTKKAPLLSKAEKKKAKREKKLK